VLLALSIFAVLLILLLGGFTGAARTLDGVTGKERELRRTAGALDRIFTDLSGAVDTSRIAAIRFECRSDTLAGFAASSVQFASFSGGADNSTRPATRLCKVRYSARLSEGGDRLDLVRERADLPLVENRLPAREGRLAAGIRGFEVLLYDGKEWKKEWPSGGGGGGTLPTRVAVTITDGEGRPFRRVVAIPLAGREADLLHSGRRPVSSP
jgi:hypothetical protein